MTSYWTPGHRLYLHPLRCECGEMWIHPVPPASGREFVARVLPWHASHVRSVQGSADLFDLAGVAL